ncbi:hypothetical protein B0J14DRAFT_623450 [Halenospora varia]|nr:hypothetical protein B0J14DRAFT_623450 [Halenospora varia]
MSAYITRGNGRYMGSQPRGSSGAFRGGPRHKTVERDEPDWPSGKLVKVVNVSDLPNLETSPKIERCEYIASYNWLDHPKYPTILVPGSPPLWSPSLSTKRLKEDSGEYFRDPNAARYPHFPAEPAFRALLAMHSDFDLSALDIVGCGSTLGNLLRFCGGINRDFRFNVDLVGDTVFFIRKESSPTVLISDICGYGHAFPEAHTTWEPDVKGSASHQRIIRYDFGGLKFMVRSESDGYLKQESEKDLIKAQSATQADNSTLFETLTVTSKHPTTDGPLEIEMRGRQIPQKAIFDTLWVNQTPYFMFAEHFRGSFEPGDIQPMRISDGMAKWESDHEALLKCYQAVIMEIIATTRSSATGKLQIIRKASGPLEIQERVAGDNADVLPHDLYSRWRKG